MSKKLASTWLIVFFGLTSAASYCEDTAEEVFPTGSLWCGQVLCGWSVEAGKVEKAATWHSQDYGVSMLGQEVVISQIAEPISPCLSFEVLADHDKQVGLTIEVDLLADGTSEVVRSIPANHWEPVFFHLNAPGWIRQKRVVARKIGNGRAVLGRLNVLGEDPCPDGSEAVSLSDLSNGSTCQTNAECSSGLCSPVGVEGPEFNDSNRCSTCASHDQCAVDQVCGTHAESPYLGVFLTCIAPGSHALGDRCEFNEECSTGICHQEQCSTCIDDADCPEGQRCTTAMPDAFPHQCAPGQGSGGLSEPCLSDEDCQTGLCRAKTQLSICKEDGRRCQSNEDCPTFVNTLDAWEHSECLLLGSLDGRCDPF